MTAFFEFILVVLGLVAVYFMGREDGRVGEIRRRKSGHLKDGVPPGLVLVYHADGNNCLPFYVRREHNFPVLWCPSCGAECREVEATKEVGA